MHAEVAIDIGSDTETVHVINQNSLESIFQVGMEPLLILIDRPQFLKNFRTEKLHWRP